MRPQVPQIPQIPQPPQILRQTDRGPATHTRRRLLAGQVVLTAAASAAALTGCGVGGQTSSGPPLELTFRRPADQFLARAYEAQAEAFNKKKKQSRLKASFDPQAAADSAGWPAKLPAAHRAATHPHPRSTGG